MKPIEKRCANCDRVIDEPQPADVLDAEAERVFGVKNASSLGWISVCDDCYDELLEAHGVTG